MVAKQWKMLFMFAESIKNVANAKKKFRQYKVSVRQESLSFKLSYE